MISGKKKPELINAEQARSAQVPDNSLWASLAEAKLSLAKHASVSERVVRGERWAVVHNAVTGEHVRINALLLELIVELDGVTTLAELVTGIDPTFDTQSLESIASGVLTLSQNGLLSLNLASDAERLLKQHSRVVKVGLQRRWLNPLAIRIPLHNPDRWLDLCLPLFAPLINRRFLVSVLALISIALFAGVYHAHALGQEVQRIIASPGHWWLFALVYPILKFCHEFSHAITLKRLGGRVLEVGMTLLVLIPVPYVDASDAWMLPHRAQRIAVSAAGMLIEGLIASLALLLWFLVEPGLVRDLALVIAMTGSVSTLLFNGNPLMRFDGYQILQDALDMPNLARRSLSYLLYLLRRYVLHVKAAQFPDTGLRERRWLVGYGLASLSYRWFITIMIATYLVKQVFFIGMGLAVFAIYQLCIGPAVKAWRYLRTSEELADDRQYAIGVSVAIACFVLMSVVLLPLPASSRAEGVVWVEGQAELLAAEAGEVVEVLAPAGSWVAAGDVIARLASPSLDTEAAVLDTQIAALESERVAALRGDVAESRLLALDMDQLKTAAQLLDQRRAALEVRAKSEGHFAPPHGPNLIGQFVSQGGSLGHVVQPGGLRIKAVVRQNRAGLVQSGVNASFVRLAESLDKRLPAQLITETPAADRQLPSPSLASDGAGGIAVAKNVNDELETLEPVFHVELSLLANVTTSGIGGRAYVTLVHPAESLGKRWWRATRQLFLEQLSV